MHNAYYNALIEMAAVQNGRPLNQHQTKWGFQIHHIKPCCQFPGGRHDPCAHLPDNLVYLTLTQHLEAHRLLTLIHPSSRVLKYAYDMMLKETNLRYMPDTGEWVDPLSLPPVEAPQTQPKPQRCFITRNVTGVVWFSFVASLWLSVVVKGMLPHGMKLLTIPWFFLAGFGIAGVVLTIGKVWDWLKK